VVARKRHIAAKRKGFFAEWLEEQELRVLVADDDVVTGTFLKLTLTKLGYEAVVVRNGLAAWQILRGPDPPRLAILDWMMPGMSGIEIVDQLRHENRSVYTYIILISAKERQEGEGLLRAFGAGVDEFLAKPILPGALQAHLIAAHRMLEMESSLRERIADLIAERDAAKAAQHSSLSLLPGSRVQSCFEAILQQVGYDQSLAPKEAGDGAPEFTVYAALVLPNQRVWLDLKMEIGRWVAATLYEKLMLQSTKSEHELCDALGEICNMCQGEWKMALEQEGLKPLTPFTPKARNSLALPPVEGGPSQGALAFELPGPIRVTIFESATVSQDKPLGSIRSGDVLAEPIIAPQQKLAFLNRGTVLNRRYIDKIQNLLGAAPGPRMVPVIEPSPMARALSGPSI
jgi:CheY-like chemotaxis protein